MSLGPDKVGELCMLSVIGRQGRRTEIRIFLVVL